MEMTGNPGSSSSPIVSLDKLGWRCMSVWSRRSHIWRCPIARARLSRQEGVPVAIPHMEDVDRCREPPSEEATVLSVPLCVNCFKCQTQTLGGPADLVRCDDLTRGMNTGQGRDDGDTSTAVHRVRSM